MAGGLFVLVLDESVEGEHGRKENGNLGLELELMGLKYYAYYVQCNSLYILLFHDDVFRRMRMIH